LRSSTISHARIAPQAMSFPYRTSGHVLPVSHLRPCPARIAPQAMSCLADPELPVRVDSVVAVRHFVEEVEDLEPLKPVLPSLLGSIFQLM